MNTCPITTLKLHSQGKKYSPIQNGAMWRLVNNDGDVLTGYRGNIYNFKSQKNAETWLCSNLARMANAEESTPIDFVVKLHKIYSVSPTPYLQAELESITQLDAGEWLPVPCASGCDCENEPIDGGDAASIYTSFINQ